MGFLFFHFKNPKRALGGGGGGIKGREGRRPVMASEVSPLTKVAAAAGDEPSEPTSERGNGGRRR